MAWVVKEGLKARTMEFALRVMNLVDALPVSQRGKVVAYQLAKSGTSVGANYRAACRARSRAEYLSKLQIVLEEADESHFWLQLIIRSGLIPESKTRSLCNEADELTAIFNSALHRGRGDQGESCCTPTASHGRSKKRAGGSSTTGKCSTGQRRSFGFAGRSSARSTRADLRTPAAPRFGLICIVK